MTRESSGSFHRAWSAEVFDQHQVVDGRIRAREIDRAPVMGRSDDSADRAEIRGDDAGLLCCEIKVSKPRLSGALLDVIDTAVDHIEAGSDDAVHDLDGFAAID